jgi:hypothetical protein
MSIERYTDEDGKTWIGFSFPEQQKEEFTKIVTATAQEILDRMPLGNLEKEIKAYNTDFNGADRKIIKAMAKVVLAMGQKVL